MEIKSEPFGQTVGTMTQNPAKNSEIPDGQPVSETTQTGKEEKIVSRSDAKIELNRSIIQASLDVSISSGNEPMALLFKTALEGINDALKAEFGDHAIQKAHDEGLDVSPEATAGRIVQMSTAFFERYRENHGDLSEKEALSAFVELIGKGIDKGFGEARDILKGLNVLEGDIAAHIDKTYELVQEGLKKFAEDRASTRQPQTDVTEETDTKPVIES